MKALLKILPVLLFFLSATTHKKEKVLIAD